MDRNNTMQIVIIIVDTSLSARRAWIEIIMSIASNFKHSVALRKESVDRNARCRFWVLSDSVALRKESVDRNYIIKITSNTPAAVALRKESVDRNLAHLAVRPGF